jgi:hypothetical protein
MIGAENAHRVRTSSYSKCCPWLLLPLGPSCRRQMDKQAGRSGNDPEKWKPVFGKDHAQHKG